MTPCSLVRVQQPLAMPTDVHIVSFLGLSSFTQPAITPTNAILNVLDTIPIHGHSK
jgi:hypothetical protein